MTIDNEAPTVHQLYFSSDALTGSKLLNFDVQDNQYIAAIQIFNEAGNQALARISPNQTEANARVTGSVDVSEIHEDTVLVAVDVYKRQVIDSKAISVWATCMAGFHRKSPVRF